MTLSAEEKKKRRVEANRRYYFKKKQAAMNGDPEAQRKWNKDRHSRQYASVKAFIKNNANQVELDELRNLINQMLYGKD